jgi:hypothetical protein
VLQIALEQPLPELRDETLTAPPVSAPTQSPVAHQ